MNDQWGYEGDNDNSQTGEVPDGPKALRDAYKKQGEKLDAALSFIEKIEQRERTRELSSVFESLGVPEAAKVYSGDADPEKAKAWVESMRGVFGGGNPTQGTQPQGIDPAQAEQLQRMTEAGQNGTPMGNFEIAASNMSSVNSTDDIVALMRNLSHGS